MTYKPRLGPLDQERFVRMDQLEQEMRTAGFKAVAGLDEAGRGPLAGPVVAAACILDPANPIYGLNDSKKLSPAKRAWLAEEIKAKALAYAYGQVPAARIDEINILEATKEAMSAAVAQLDLQADLLLLDAIVLKDLALPQRSVIQGDAQVNCIAAASILAKTHRDQIMVQADQDYPGYGFAQHKGYGTRYHYDRIAEQGLCPLHRLSFLKKLQAGQSSVTPDQVKGRSAEAQVAQHLRAQDFTILEQNFQLPPFAEVDLIVSKKGQLFFIEVKARQDQAGISWESQALAAFDKSKRRKYALVAKYYAESRGWQEAKLRLLLAACQLNSQGQLQHIRFFEAD
ncbi:MAG: ribonuclease HII [Eubacteriales bacterium]|nr:ribonuclease HII [Eubacteriales bacterium]